MCGQWLCVSSGPHVPETPTPVAGIFVQAALLRLGSQCSIYHGLNMDLSRVIDGLTTTLTDTEVDNQTAFFIGGAPLPPGGGTTKDENCSMPWHPA